MNNLFLYILSLCIKLLSRNRLLILNYHRVMDSKDVFFKGDLDLNAFSWHMKLIKKYLSPLPLNVALPLMKENNLPDGAIVVTFDDGYKDNVENALPILLEYSITATFFIATSFLNKGIMWNDIVIESIKRTKKKVIDLTELGLPVFELKNTKKRIKAIEQIIKALKYKTYPERLVYTEQVALLCDISIPDNLMMNDEDIIILSNNNMEIGGHTANHPILSCETDELVLAEIKKGKVYLERLLNSPLSSFAYPNGKKNKDYSRQHPSMIKGCHFKSSVTTNEGLNNKNTDNFELKRFTPWDKTDVTFMLRLLRLYLFNKV